MKITDAMIRFMDAMLKSNAVRRDVIKGLEDAFKLSVDEACQVYESYTGR